MISNPLTWGKEVLKAAVELKLVSAVHSTLIWVSSFIILLLSPLLTEEYFVRLIVTVVALVVFVSELGFFLFRSWPSRRED